MSLYQEHLANLLFKIRQLLHAFYVNKSRTESMKVLKVVFLLLAFTCTHAQAFFIIDFNEQWLREDAYNRAMNQARKNLRPVDRDHQARPQDRNMVSKGANARTDVLYTGPLEIAGRFQEKDSVEQLVQLFPAEQRKEARPMIVKVITEFNNVVEKTYDVPKENVATGLVTLLAGAYAAYYNQTFPDKLVKPTVQQIWTYLQEQPELFQNKTSEKMTSYQTSVGLGMLLMLLQKELQKSPNPEYEAELKQVGASVFRAILQVEPDQAQFTTTGIRFD